MKILNTEDETKKHSEEWREGFNAGVHSVIAIRCIDHRAAPLANHNECSGGECPVCEYQDLRDEINQLLKDSRGLQP